MDKFISYCQIAFKSRQVEFGDALIPCIQHQNAYCVVMDELTGNNRKKKLRNKCAFYQIPLYELSSQRFEQITNKAINSFAITSKEIAEEMQKLEG
ncbi:MAG: hypothetical protein KBT48_08705 [Firmicutes bacterium]|nr:hypothetical protein [Bacillota bacterium]